MIRNTSMVCDYKNNPLLISIVIWDPRLPQHPHPMSPNKLFRCDLEQVHISRKDIFIFLFRLFISSHLIYLSVYQAKCVPDKATSAKDNFIVIYSTYFGAHWSESYNWHQVLLLLALYNNFQIITVNTCNKWIQK